MALQLERPGVSVIVPAYNAERFLEQTMSSVCSQNVPLELIVVNDGSNDCTGALAEKAAATDARIRGIHQANAGVAVSRNKGLAAANPGYPYALFLDADDLLEPNALSVLADCLSQHAGAAAAYGACRLINEHGHPAGDARIKPQIPTDQAVLAVRNCVQAPGAVLIRKSAMAEIGPWDQGIAGVADWDYWFRLASVGAIEVTAKVVLAYRIHGAGMSRNGRMMRRAGMVMRRQWLDRGDARTRRLVRAGYRRSVREIAKKQLQSPSVRRLPQIMFCLAKSLPMVPDVILSLAPRKPLSPE